MRKRKGSSTIGIGVIGLGWGQWHINNYRSLKDVKVVAVCDGNTKHLVEVAKKFNIKCAYRRPADLLRNPEVDAVSVVIPNYLHAPIVKAALKAGKHVLCEKPLANTIENGEAIVKAAQKSRKTFMLGMPYRFSAEAYYIRGLLDRGSFGEVYSGFNQQLRGVGGIPLRPGGWFTTKRKSGGGTLIDIGVHFLDVNWYLMGCPKPVAAFGKTYAKFGPKIRWSPRIDVEDLATGFITFSNGASVYVGSAWSVANKSGFGELAIFGTKGGATMWPFSVTRIRHGKAVDETPKSFPKYAGEFRHFIDCVKTGRRLTISPVTQGLTMLKMIDAIYRSHASGGLVRIK